MGVCGRVACGDLSWCVQLYTAVYCTYTCTWYVRRERRHGQWRVGRTKARYMLLYLVCEIPRRCASCVLLLLLWCTAVPGTPDGMWNIHSTSAVRRTPTAEKETRRRCTVPGVYTRRSVNGRAGVNHNTNSKALRTRGSSPSLDATSSAHVLYTARFVRRPLHEAGA